MPELDAMRILSEKAAEIGQAETARRLNLSASAVNQLLHNKYKASPDSIFKRVIEIFGGISVVCPVLGEIPLADCAEERKRPFAASNHLRVKLFRACRECKGNRA